MATYTDFTFGQNLGTTLTDVHAASSAGQVREYNYLSIANVDGVNAASVDLLATNGTISVYILKGVSVAALTTLYLVGDERPRLAAGWKLQARASASGDLDLFCSGAVRS